MKLAVPTKKNPLCFYLMYRRVPSELGDKPRRGDQKGGILHISVLFKCDYYEIGMKRFQYMDFID